MKESEGGEGEQRGAKGSKGGVKHFTPLCSLNHFDIDVTSMKVK